MTDQTSNYNARGGRPMVGDPRKHTLSTKLNRSELRAVLSRIAASGLKRSEALRLLVLNEELPKVIHRGVDITATQAYQNLQPLQSNLNQIAHAFNVALSAGKLAEVKPERVEAMMRLLQDTASEVKSIRQEILSANGAES